MDGTTGLAILWHVLDRAGANVGFYVPHRVEEGFGLNLEAAKQLIAEGTELEILNTLNQYVPYCIFKVHSIASESQVNEMIKALTG